jgi:superfamily II DNA or RNA helicase
MLFCKFIGRDSSGSNFLIDIEKAKKNGLRASEIIDFLEELGVELSEEEKSRLKEQLPDHDVEFFYDNKRGIVKFKSRLYLYSLVPELKETVKYNKIEKIFEIQPFQYANIIKLLQDKKIIIKPIKGFKEFEFEFNGQLRPYQKESIERWINNNYNGIIALPTGAGKTIVGIKAIEIVKKPTLIVTYTREQMIQWRDSIVKFSSIRPEIGLFYADENKIRPITIATYQKAQRYMKEIGDQFDLLIIDEVHHLPAESFRKIATYSIATKRLGLSATPYREDGKHEELFKLMGGLVYFKSAEELVALGYLAKYEVRQVIVELNREEKKKYIELLKKFKILSKNKKISELLELVKKNDENAVEALKVYNEIKKLVSSSRSKIVALEDILRKEVGKKILIFTQYIEQAEEIAKRFNALLLTGKMSEKERKKVLDAFKFMKAGILVLTTVGDEGLDVPDASVGIIVTGTGSRRQFIQRLGRLLRPSSNKKAILYEIVVRGTSEEYQSKRRKEDLMDNLYYYSAEEDG